MAQNNKEQEKKKNMNLFRSMNGKIEELYVNKVLRIFHLIEQQYIVHFFLISCLFLYVLCHHLCPNKIP